MILCISENIFRQQVTENLTKLNKTESYLFIYVFNDKFRGMWLLALVHLLSNDTVFFCVNLMKSKRTGGEGKEMYRLLM